LGEGIEDRWGCLLTESGLQAKTARWLTDGIAARLPPFPPPRRPIWLSNFAAIQGSSSSSHGVHPIAVESGVILGFFIAALCFPIAWWMDVGLIVVVAFLTGFTVLQFAEVKSLSPAELEARALGTFNTAAFAGVAAMQWLTGFISTELPLPVDDPFVAVYGAIA
jgi:hypothetical protein